jgi:hypothetical protein
LEQKLFTATEKIWRVSKGQRKLKMLMTPIHQLLYPSLISVLLLEIVELVLDLKMHKIFAAGC